EQSIVRWTPEACESERQSLSLLSERIKLSIAQLQALAGQPAPATTNPQRPPSLSCTSQTLGDQTRTTCEPEPTFGSAGRAGFYAMQQAQAQQAAAARYAAAQGQVRAQQAEFDRRFQELESNCRAR